MYAWHVPWFFMPSLRVFTSAVETDVVLLCLFFFSIPASPFLSNLSVMASPANNHKPSGGSFGLRRCANLAHLSESMVFYAAQALSPFFAWSQECTETDMRD